jgi:uncharacterized protein (UPF0332 family)
MSVTPSDLLKAVQKIAALADTEALHRSEISRAYYAALHKAKETFVHVEFRTQKGASSHEQIIREVEIYAKGANPGRVEASAVAKLLPKLKRQRQDADYQLNMTLQKQDSNDVLVKVQDLFDKCNAALTKIQNQTNH